MLRKGAHLGGVRAVNHRLTHCCGSSTPPKNPKAEGTKKNMNLKTAAAAGEVTEPDWSLLNPSTILEAKQVCWRAPQAETASP